MALRWVDASLPGRTRGLAARRRERPPACSARQQMGQMTRSAAASRRHEIRDTSHSVISRPLALCQVRAASLAYGVGTSPRRHGRGGGALLLSWCRYYLLSSLPYSPTVTCSWSGQFPRPPRRAKAARRVRGRSLLSCRLGLVAATVSVRS